jgi:hypothetical protein
LQLFDVLDLNGNGRIELDEFVRTVVDQAAFVDLYARYLQRRQGLPAAKAEATAAAAVPTLTLAERGREASLFFQLFVFHVCVGPVRASLCLRLQASTRPRSVPIDCAFRTDT